MNINSTNLSILQAIERQHESMEAQELAQLRAELAAAKQDAVLSEVRMNDSAEYDDLVHEFADENRKLRAELAAAKQDADRLREAWKVFLSAEKIIEQSGFMDNYTDAARARKRQSEAIKMARAALFDSGQGGIIGGKDG